MLKIGCHLSAAKGYAHMGKAVSYTHLDVYTRQVKFHTGGNARERVCAGTGEIPVPTVKSG